jgi:transcriptional regulator with XRE-family HTH domain
VIAELMGIPSRCISQYERGDRKPSVETLVKIAEFYGTSTDYLLGLKEER